MSGSATARRPNRALASNFNELPEDELPNLSDEELIDYMRGARAAGKEGAVRLALAILVFGYLPIMERRAALKMPWADAQDVAVDAMESALKAAFDGVSVGEFRNWINRILQRRIADFHRRREGKPTLEPLPTGDEADDDPIWGDVPSVEFEGVPVDLHRALKQCYDELSEQHQRVVDMYVFADWAAAEVSAETGETEANVHQIGSRFRKCVRDRLDDRDTSD